ncbi:MAG TPA: phospholipase D-like domain-containing protein [Terriglobia bacterium]|nr:phospholipase D-like domain-containing protein [Terriglobia bacterium]
MATDVIFTRSGSAANVIEELIRQARLTVDAALYRFSNRRLARALGDAAARGVAVRLVLNSNDHYEENRAAQETLRDYGIAFRLSRGRGGPGSKMHHKFAVFDRRWVVTGSYNWTLESEGSNYENLLALGSRRVAVEYSREFEKLWAEGGASAGSVKNQD